MHLTIHPRHLHSPTTTLVGTEHTHLPLARRLLVVVQGSQVQDRMVRQLDRRQISQVVLLPQDLEDILLRVDTISMVVAGGKRACENPIF